MFTMSKQGHTFGILNYPNGKYEHTNIIREFIFDIFHHTK